MCHTVPGKLLPRYVSPDRPNQGANVIKLLLMCSIAKKKDIGVSCYGMLTKYWLA